MGEDFSCEAPSSWLWEVFASPPSAREVGGTERASSSFVFKEGRKGISGCLCQSLQLAVLGANLPAAAEELLLGAWVQMGGCSGCSAVGLGWLLPPP